ncbi:MAG TPA: helix-turn-helix domain-containing protein [Gemmataceae bacterium]|nr:helix-turn-helix domain-containing protein [Gemmataceae bacterium]
MSKKSTRPSLFERLKQGLEEGIQFAKGEISLRTTEVEDQRAPTMSAKQIAALRKRLAMSPTTFARTLNVSLKTVQDWEQGERAPSQAALRLLQVLAAQPQMVGEIVGGRVKSN